MGDNKDTDCLDQSKVHVSDSCFCCYEGLICDTEALGCMGSNTLLCLESEFCIKFSKIKEPLCCNPSNCQCGFCCCATRCVSVKTCCKSQGQCCCFVSGAAIPPDEEVPCMLSSCGLMCYPKVGCCNKIGDLTAKEADAKEAENKPAQQDMS